MSQRPRYGADGLPLPQDYPYPVDPAASDPYPNQYADQYPDQYASDPYAAEFADGSVDPYQWDDQYDEPPPRYRVISFFRVLVALLVVAAGAVAFYGIVINPQLALAVSGLGVMGLALGVLAFSLAGAAAALGRRGNGGRALLAALFGGFCALAGAGALAAAIVLGLLAAST